MGTICGTYFLLQLRRNKIKYDVWASKNIESNIDIWDERGLERGGQYLMWAVLARKTELDIMCFLPQQKSMYKNIIFCRNQYVEGRIRRSHFLRISDYPIEVRAVIDKNTFYKQSWPYKVSIQKIIF